LGRKLTGLSGCVRIAGTSILDHIKQVNLGKHFHIFDGSNICQTYFVKLYLKIHLSQLAYQGTCHMHRHADQPETEEFLSW